MFVHFAKLVWRWSKSWNWNCSKVYSVCFVFCYVVVVVHLTFLFLFQILFFFCLAVLLLFMNQSENFLSCVCFSVDGVSFRWRFALRFATHPKHKFAYILPCILKVKLRPLRTICGRGYFSIHFLKHLWLKWGDSNVSCACLWFITKQFFKTISSLMTNGRAIDFLFYCVG